MESSPAGDPDVVMAPPEAGDASPAIRSSSPASSSLLSVVASGELPSLPQDVTESASDEGLHDLLAPFLPLFTRLQHSRRSSSASHPIPKATQIDRVLLRCQEASKWRQYAQVFEQVTLAELKGYASSVKVTAAFRRFESGSAAERARIVLCEWLLQPPGTLESCELFANELYVDEVAVILVHTLASNSLQTQQNTAINPLGIHAVTRKCLAVPLGPILLARLAVNDPTSVEQVMDTMVAVIVESAALTTEQRKPIAQQEQEAMAGLTPIQENARLACIKLAQLTPLYATRLRDKLSEQTTSLHCAATAFELLTKCTSAKDVSVFLYQWLKRDGGSGSVIRTYVQIAAREPASPPSEFQHAAGKNLAKVQKVLLDTLDLSTSTATPYELSVTLGTIIGLQVMGSFPLEEDDRVRLLQRLDALTAISSSRVDQEHELAWARGVLGLTYALQFNQRLRQATMVAGSKLSSLVSTSSVVSGGPVSAAFGPGSDICLRYDLSAFPLRNIVTQALMHGDQGGAFEYVAPTLMKLLMEEHPQLFDAAPSSISSGSTLKLLPLAVSPPDMAERDVATNVTSPSPRLLLAIHAQGYDVALVPSLVEHVPAMKLLWDYWMESSSRSTSNPGTKPLMEFVAEGAEKDLTKWRYRLRVVLSLCAKYLSGSRQSSAMQQALRVVWNKLRNGVGNLGENSAGYVKLLGEVLPWIVEACCQNADLSAELVHFLLKLQKLQQDDGKPDPTSTNRSSFAGAHESNALKIYSFRPAG
ncbi:hypothetical protein PHYBOEH_008784 [Phytophthora boehmeriae]|uniref:Uncharacterized protein n=1 Tax=Phytophthora boehmeriae TaxID=109152 RepID=A0A8T1VYV1_9STRA|nr:hypothetical protein PHYBOEH_008784 [Phytophthora boehmeriae]